MNYLPFVLFVLLSILGMGCSQNTPSPISKTQNTQKAVKINPQGPVYFWTKAQAYEVQLERKGDLQLSLKALKPYKVNRDYPILFKTEEKNFDQFEIAKDHAVLHLGNLDPQKAQGIFQFGVCTPEKCLMHKVKIQTQN